MKHEERLMSGLIAIVPRGGKRMKYNGQVISDEWIDTKELLMVRATD